MNYDLTSFLQTVAAASASIVAIIGGLIASRLITINTERNEIQARLSEVETEIAVIKTEVERDQNDIDEDDALDFLHDNIKELVEQKPLDEVYKVENRPRIEKNTLQKYWDRANATLKLMYDDDKEHEEDTDIAMNEDDLPISLVEQIKNDFEYEIAKRIAKYFDQQTRQSRYGSTLSAIISPPEISMTGIWYSKAKERIVENQNKIDLLTTQKSQLQIRGAALKRPKGMKMGLFIFSLFSIANIIYPLSISPFNTSDIKAFLTIKAISIGLLSTGLLAIVFYLAYLLADGRK